MSWSNVDHYFSQLPIEEIDIVGCPVKNVTPTHTRAEGQAVLTLDVSQVGLPRKSYIDKLYWWLRLRSNVWPQKFAMELGGA
jgi:hypothetical protein